MSKDILVTIHGRKIGLSDKGSLVINGVNGQGIAVASIDGGAMIRKQGTPTAVDVTATLTIAQILTGIITSTTAAAVTGTLPTGALIDAAVKLDVDDAIEWKVINTGSNAFTIEAADGHTIVGAAAVGAGSSARFLTRRTAANTFVTYRV